MVECAHGVEGVGGGDRLFRSSGVAGIQAETCFCRGRIGVADGDPDSLRCRMRDELAGSLQFGRNREQANVAARRLLVAIKQRDGRQLDVGNGGDSATSALGPRPRLVGRLALVGSRRSA